MKINNPFQKSFTIGLVPYVAFAILFVANGANVESVMGALLVPYLVSATVSGAWEFFTKKTWSWLRSVYTEVGFYIFVLLIGIVGSQR